jgi:hypothetical protein
VLRPCYVAHCKNVHKSPLFLVINVAGARRLTHLTAFSSSARGGFEAADWTGHGALNERKLVTIVYADVAGYSRPIGSGASRG